MAYEEFFDLTKKYFILEHIEEGLDWDKEVIMQGGVNERSAQMSLLATLKHEILTDSRFAKLIDELKKQELSQEQKCNVKEMDRLASRARKIPAELVKKLSESSSQAFHIWKEAREKKDFSIFAPRLKEMVALKREYAQACDEGSLYDKLLEDYEPHITSKTINVLFEEVKKELVPLRKAIEQAEEPDNFFLFDEIDHDTQLKYCKSLAQDLGFDFSRGRLDVSTHPFTCHPADVRITTRFTNGWGEAVTSTTHETGHGLYEQGLPLEHYATPRGTAASLSVHESQSRLFENHVGLSEEFWKPRFSKLKETYGLQQDFATFIKALNKVQSSFIRVQADELTYPFHIILRYEIERDLIEGKIEVDELPEVWNKKMQELLGIVPPDDSLGVLQDVHWSVGLFGYFPTYLLGSMISAQLVEAMDEKGLKQEEYLGFLREKIHTQGCLRDTQELLEFATGKKLTSQAYIKYLKDKYTQIYNL